MHHTEEWTFRFGWQVNVLFSCMLKWHVNVSKSAPVHSFMLCMPGLHPLDRVASAVFLCMIVDTAMQTLAPTCKPADQYEWLAAVFMPYLVVELMDPAMASCDRLVAR